MHGTEYLVDILLGKAALVFSFHQNLVQLFKKRRSLKDIHIRHCFHSRFKFCHKNTYLSVYPLTGFDAASAVCFAEPVLMTLPRHKYFKGKMLQHAIIFYTIFLIIL